MRLRRIGKIREMIEKTTTWYKGGCSYSVRTDSMLRKSNNSYMEICVKVFLKNFGFMSLIVCVCVCVRSLTDTPTKDVKSFWESSAQT